MTYIKWKDEVESYLGNLPQEEKQKVFSYFSEMYADKRDAGKSEAQIIEEFGAPYDVAQRILSDSRDTAAQSGGVNGGNNYNYNYYNYNYGGSPQGGMPQLEKQTTTDGVATPPPAPSKKKRSAARIVFGVIFAIILAILSVALIGSALAIIVESFISIGTTAGALAASKCGGADGAALIGYGLICAGVGCILIAPFSLLVSAMWRGYKKFIKGGAAK